MLVELRKRQPKGWGAFLLSPRPKTGHEGFTVIGQAENRITLQLDNPHCPRILDCDIVQAQGASLQLQVRETRAA